VKCGHPTLDHISALSLSHEGVCVWCGGFQFLFGLSLFFTFARAFLPDMEQPAQMDMMWMAPTLFSMLK